MKTTFNVGDKAIITKEGTHSYKVGEVVELVEDGFGSGQLRTKRENGHEPMYPFVYLSEMRLLDDKYEVIEETAQKSEGETQMTTTFNIGDKVRVVNVEAIFMGGAHYYNGMETEVLEVNKSEYGSVTLRNKEGNPGVYIDENELHAIELIEDVRMTKRFKTGDKAVLITTNGPLFGFEPGEVVIVNADYNGGSEYSVMSEDFRRIGFTDGYNIMPVEETPQQSEGTAELEARVSVLEKEIEELKAQLTLVEKPVITGRLAVVSTNETRKRLIEEAKTFVEEVTKSACGNKMEHRGNRTFQTCTTVAHFFVNKEKGVVTVLAKGKVGARTFENGFAKCAPGDVFNEDLGKAIALGRAYGLESEIQKFIEAPQPTEIVVGMMVEDMDAVGLAFGTGKVKAVRPPGFCSADEGYTVEGGGWNYLRKAIIKEDTDAKY